MIAAIYEFHIHQIDVVGAYLHGEFRENIYMKQPLEYDDGTEACGDSTRRCMDSSRRAVSETSSSIGNSLLLSSGRYRQMHVSTYASKDAI